jgi:2-polyprenyl-6-methoxyphenol hydroxylase-like FAD-dependent oxidoreductase
VFERFHTPTGVAITGPGGATAAIEDSTIAHGDFHGYVVPRLDLDEALKNAAVAAGATFREGVTFKGIELSDGGRGCRFSSHLPVEGSGSGISTGCLIGLSAISFYRSVVLLGWKGQRPYGSGRHIPPRRVAGV